MTTQYMEQYDNIIWNLTEEEEKCNAMTTKTVGKHLFLQGQELVTRWGIGLKDAENIIEVTTQKFIRSAVHSIERRFCTMNIILRYNQLGCHFNNNTFFSSIKSLQQTTCGQLFITEFSYAKLLLCALSQRQVLLSKNLSKMLEYPKKSIQMEQKN